MIVTCDRRIQWCSGHRVHQHESKCRNLHGHNYVALIHAHAEGLDSIGRVIDFGVLKTVVGAWIDENWDHGFILWEEDPLAKLWEMGHALASHKFFLLRENPTAENMAKYLLEKSSELLVEAGHPEVVVVRIDLWETENCRAVAEYGEVQL